MVDRFERFSMAIAAISRYWHRLAAEEMEKFGLQGPHASYLTVIARYPEGITVPELCTLCGRDKSDASRMLGILEARGLLCRMGEGGRYRARVALTEAGRAIAEQVCRRASRAVEEAGQDLSEAERTAFYRALDAITARLKQMDREGIPQ